MVTTMVTNVAHSLGKVSTFGVRAICDVFLTKVAVVVAIPALALCEHGLLFVWAVVVNSNLFDYL